VGYIDGSCGSTLADDDYEDDSEIRAVALQRNDARQTEVDYSSSK